jgi:hypothetical protein
MKSQPANDELREFHTFVGAMLKNGSSHLSPEEALGHWRDQQREPGEFPDDTEAIEEALQDMINGDKGRPYEEVMAELRAKHGLPKR